MNGVKIAAIAAGISLVAIGAAAPFTDLPVRAVGAVAGASDVLSMLHKRSPEERPEGALASTKERVSAVLPVAASPAPPKVAAAAPAAKPAIVTYAVPATPMALPAAVVPAVATALPLAAAPAAAGGGLFIPPLVVPGGGGGGGITTLVTPPTPPAAVPGVPEPATWAMMIIGFGLLGGLLRRRRRFASEHNVARADYAALATRA